MYLKQRPDELEKLIDIAKVQSTEASNAIEGIVTTDTRIRHQQPAQNNPGKRSICRQNHSKQEISL